MIDTIKFGIPISKNQHGKLERLVRENSDWQWVMFNAKAGELRFIRHKGLAKLDQQSFRREVLWDIPEFYQPKNTYLTIELSLPKYWYGHNIHLLYGYMEATEELRKTLQKQLHLRLPKITDWQVWRADICYSWRCPSQRISEQILDSIKKLHFPRKRPHIYADSVMFTGTTYSLKFYLKLPEFIAHDRKALLKSNARLDWINHLEEKADGVLRCEATLRRKYLKRNNIETLADLNASNTYFKNDDEIKKNYPGIDDEPLINTYTTLCILNYLDPNTSITFFKDGLYTRSELLENFNKDHYFYAPKHTSYFLDGECSFKGGGFYTIQKPKIIDLLNKNIVKLIGDNTGMDTLNQIEDKLAKVYKNHKVADLVGFWLYVQRKGVKAAKDRFNKDKFYRNKRALKDAGVSLVEPVKLIDASNRFIKEFKIEVPSYHATNKFDDHRDSDNILNLPSTEEA